MRGSGARDAPGMPSAQAGSTPLEVLIVLAIIGILANLALPLTVYLVKRAQARSIVNDFLAVQQAAIEYRSAHGRFPGEHPAGQEPPELTPYLRSRIDWNNSRLAVQYDWENWTTASGAPRYPAFGALVGFTVQTGNRDLLQMIRSVCRGPYVVTFRNTRITLAIQTR